MRRCLSLSDPVTVAFFASRPGLCPEKVMRHAVDLMQEVVSAPPPPDPLAAQFRSSTDAPTTLESSLATQFPTCSIDVFYEQNQRFIKMSRSGVAHDVLLMEHAGETNADAALVDLFLRAVAGRPETHGILVSQRAGVWRHHNFAHRVLDGGRIALFLHRCNHSLDQIRAAIEIVDALAARADLLGSQAFTHTLTEEYRKTHGARVALRDFAKSVTKRIDALVDRLRIPSLDAELAQSLSIHGCPSCTFHTTDANSLDKHLRKKQCRVVGAFRPYDP